MSIPVLSGLTDALNLYQRSVVDPIAGTGLGLLNKAKMGLGQGDAGSQQLDSYFQNGIGPGANADPTGALNFGTQGPAGAWGRFGLTAAMDPLNLVGLGLPGMAAHGLEGMGMLSKVPGLADALGGLGKLDALPGALTGKVMDTVGDVAGPMVTGAAGKLAPFVNDFAAEHKDLSQGWTTANLVWKQLNHMLPGQQLGYMADDTTRVLAHGNAGAVGDMIQARGGLLGGSGSTEGDKWAETLGQRPELVSPEAANIPQQSIFTPSNELNKDPWGDPSKGLPFQDWVQAHQDTPVLGGLLQGLRKAGQNQMNIEKGVEGQMRGAVWGSGMNDAMKGPGDELTARMDANGAPELAQMMRDQNYMVHPDALKQTMLQMGYDAKSTDRVAQQWADQIGAPSVMQGHPDPITGAPVPGVVTPASGAFEAANDVTKRQMLDYTNPTRPTNVASDSPEMQRYEGEMLLRGLAANTFGGYKFATSNIPSFMRLTGAHPAIANVPQDYYRNSDQYNLQHGLPESYHGLLPMGNVGGKDLMVNPFSLSSMGQLVGDMGKPADPMSGNSALGDIADTASDVGFGLNPIINAALIASGQKGSTQLPNIIRPLTPIGAAIGAGIGRPVDLEGPVKALGSATEQALTGRQTGSYQDFLLRKRQVELSGGNPMAVDNPTPTANQDVANSQAVEQLITALTGFRGMKEMAPEEAQIRMNQRQGAVEQILSGSTQGVASNPTRGAYDITDPLMEKIYRFSSLTPIEQRHLMEDPVANQIITQNRSELLHGGPGGYMR